MKHKRQLGLALVLLVVMLCAACGANVIRGAAPIVRMNDLSRTSNGITLQLSMRNLNGVPLDTISINFSLIVKDDDLLAYTGPAETNIAANGTETWTVELQESESGRALLDSLQSGDIKSLPYSLEGSISSRNDGRLRFQHEGHLFPVPGRPGHFR